MHGIVSKNVQDFIEPNVNLRKLLERLTKADKQLFLVTNSPYNFV